jgi:acetylornithine deacetylase
VSDSGSLVALARTLIDIDSTTGREAEACAWLAEYLRASGFSVTVQPVEGGRANLLATLDPPVVVLSTHIDCVPPFFPSRIENDRLYGRGACDAKGILAAQTMAALRLRESGERRVGLLFVVGEERGSDGAAAAEALAPGSRFLVDGEPTESKLGLATRGVLRLRLLARGRAAHSSQPQRGISAIDRLVDAVVELRSLALPEDPQLGRTFYSVGLVSGGIAPNVISPAAEAEVLFRTVGPGDEVLERMAPLRRLVTIEKLLEVPPVRLHAVPGLATDVFAFTTDIPLLARWGRPLLFGPGSILLAHSDDEHVNLTELEASVDTYVALAQGLLPEAAV